MDNPTLVVGVGAAFELQHRENRSSGVCQWYATVDARCRPLEDLEIWIRP